jgi:hypothetical protein
MSVERTPQPSGLRYRRAEPRVPGSAFLNPVPHARDEGWPAHLWNTGRPPIPPGAAVPANAITSVLAPGEHYVSIAPGMRPNPISGLLDRPDEATT